MRFRGLLSVIYFIFFEPSSLLWFSLAFKRGLGEPVKTVMGRFDRETICDGR